MWQIWLTVMTITVLTSTFAQESSEEEDDIRPYLLLANTFDIRRLNFDGTGYRFLTSSLSGTVAMDYDYTTGYMYWSHTDGGTKTISRAPLETGSPIEDVITTNLGEPDGLAIDWVNRKLFWTDGALNLIERANLDGSQRGVLISSGTQKPRGIALDPHANYMYFTDVSDTAPSIKKAYLTGGYSWDIVSTGLQRPNGLTIDYEEGRLYFADAHTDRIESCNLDGSDRRLILDRPSTFHPYGLTVYQDRLYWSDILQHHIMHVDKETGSNRVKLEGYFAYPTALHVVHPSRQLLENRDWCEANDGLGPCDHICQNTYNGYECRCQEGYEPVNDDENACQDLNECSFGNGGCNHQCVNTEGVFHCECIGGFGLLPDGLTCADLNECHTSNAGCQYTCHNTETGYFCTCPFGLTLMTDKHMCTDHDECQSYPCPADGFCANTHGSYTCYCTQGFHYNAMSNMCVDIDECVTGASRCSQKCLNVPGSYRCDCHAGFILPPDGVSCIDINECDQNNHGCDQRCTNIMGSYICSCLEGFHLNNDDHTCSVIQCGQSSSIPGFHVSCHGNNYGNTCSLTCAQGQLIGNPIITCQSNSHWSTATAECITTTQTSSDENQPPLRVYLSSNTIPEDALIGAIVGTVNAIDVDTTQTFTYALTGGDVATFVINTADNTLRTQMPLNFESSTTYSVSITATDNGTPPLSVTSDLTVLVLDVNEKPSSPTLTNSFLSELAKPGDTVGQLKASDPDQGQVMTFALLGNANGVFDLSDDDMVILSGTVNYEAMYNLYITVLVTDSGQPPLSTTDTLNIQLYDRNDAPTDITLTPDTIPEATAGDGTTTGTKIGELSTVDEDISWDEFTYILTGDNSACFEILQSDLLVLAPSCFDFETDPVVDVTIITTDKGAKTIQRTLHVKLTDVNEAPTGIVLSSNVVREHTDINTVVGVLTVIDSDHGDSHTFFLGAHQNDAFKIEGNKLVVNNDISYNDFPSGLVIGLGASDRNGLIYTQNYAIHVQDVNEPPGEITWEILQPCTQDQSSFNGIQIDACVEEEHTASATIARPNITDPDGDQLTWTILDSSESFTIETDGTVRVGDGRLSYEVFERHSHGPVQSVIIIAMDPSGYSTSSQLNIRLLDINDAPRRVVISNAYVASNTAVGQTVATLVCDDEDPDDHHTFSYVYPISEFNIVGNQVKVSASLQGQINQHITTYITCSDGVEETEGGYIQMHIFDVGQTNDMLITLNPSYIVENSVPNQQIGIIQAKSASLSDTLYPTFSLPAIYQEQFSIQAVDIAQNTASLHALSSFDYESTSTVDVVVKVVSFIGSAVQHLTINVLDVNEPPENITLTSGSVPENEAGVLVGILSAIDPEADEIEFAIISDPADAFELDEFDISNAKKLITSRKLDYETEPSLTLTIGVTESTGFRQSTSRTFHISVSNINEAPSRIEPIRFEVEENTVARTTVGSLTVTDVDDWHTRIDCLMKDDGGGLFTVSGTYIEVANGASLDYESFPPHTKTIQIQVECFDQGQLSVSADIDMVITDVNEPPTNIVSQSGVFEIEENNIGGDTVAILQTLDPETMDPVTGTFTYTTSAEAITFPFIIIGDRVIAHQSLNYEEKRFYDMEITSTDSGKMSFTKTIRITVLDANDPPTAIVTPSAAKIFEHSNPGTFICSLSVIDEDINQDHYFLIESQTPEGAVLIHNSTFMVVGDAKINFESTNQVSVTLKVRDIGDTESMLYVETLILDVEDVSESPTGVHLSAYSIVENPKIGTQVAQVIVEDPDLLDQVFYCFIGFDGTNTFQLAHQQDSIWLVVGYEITSFDYEEQGALNVTLWCRDSDPQHFAQATFTIELEDVNDPPTGLVFLDAEEGIATTNASQPLAPDVIGNVITAQTVTIREDTPVSIGVVCYIFVIDEDAVSGSEAAHQSAVVELISQDEFEGIMGSAGHTRRRRSDRIYSRTRRQTSDEPWRVSEDFVIQSGTNYLLVNNKLDHETRDEYEVFFKACDPDMPNTVVAASLRVVVMDVDEAPQDIMLTSTVVTENSVVNSKIGDLSVFDPDGTQTGYIYTMISLGTPFHVIGSGLYVERHPLDYEVTPAISVQMQVREIATSLVRAKTFHINVTDVPEAPTSLTVNGNITLWVPETLTYPMSLGTIMSNDPDHYDEPETMTYSFFNQAPSKFQIDGDELMLVEGLDSWQYGLYDLPMQVMDSTGLTFRQVILVRVIEEDQCEGEGYCSPHATCLHNQCQCKPGFKGDGFSCVDHNECIPNPCDVNNSYGACENGIGGLRNFTCKCRPNWTGPDCTNKIDLCNDNLCNEQGTLECKNKDSAYICACKEGFRGVYCDEDVDHCVDHQCQNGGSCTDKINGYVCDCPQPYVGLLCETNDGLCSKVSCPYNGTCIPITDKKKTVCRCLEPFAADCQGCAYGYGGADCVPCEPPLTGANCEIDSSVCEPNPCEENQICVPHLNMASCLCQANDVIRECTPTNITLVQEKQVKWTETTGGLSSLVVAAIALMALIVLILALLYYRKLRDKSKPWGRARFNSESQAVIIDHPEQGGVFTDDISWPGTQYPAMAQHRPQRSPKNNIVSVKVSNDIRETRNPSVSHISGDPVADFVGAIAKPLSSRGRHISSAKKNNLGEWEKNMAYSDDNFDDLKKGKNDNLYVDMPQRELPVGAVVFKSDQWNPSQSRHKSTSHVNQSPRRRVSNNGDAGIEEDIENDNRQMQGHNSDGKRRISSSLKDNPVFQGSDSEDDEVPTSII